MNIIKDLFTGVNLSIVDKKPYSYIKLKLYDPLNAKNVSQNLFNQFSIMSSN